MANFETEPKFTELMRMFETSDPAHADLFNGIIGKLLNNDVFLRNVANQLLLQLQQHISDSQSTLDSYYQQSSGYTDQKIADLIGGAPSTLDTLGEIAQAMQTNEDVVAALDEAIGKKANAAEFDSHIKDKSNPHKVKATQAEAVSFSESQELSETQKAMARANIGAGTSSFSGNYNDLLNLPAIPDISGKVNKSGDTITGQLRRDPVDYFYLYGRDGAMIRQNGREGTYDPILSSKTVNGSWDMGAKNDIMHLYFISDKDHDNHTAYESADIQFRPDGTIGATADNAVNADMLDGKHASDFIGADGAASKLGYQHYVVYPEGGQLSSNNDLLVGYLRITLPHAYINSMIKFTVSIFNYGGNTSVDYIVSGHNYYGDRHWYGVTAICLGKYSDRLSNLPVIFGDISGKCAITIGNSDTQWNSPTIVIHDVIVGFEYGNYENWRSGWGLSISPESINNTNYGGTIINTNIAYNVGNADTVDGIHVKFVPALPSDAASHPDTLYIISE